MIKYCTCKEFKLWYQIRRTEYTIKICACGHRDTDHMTGACDGEIVVVDGGV